MEREHTFYQRRIHGLSRASPWSLAMFIQVVRLLEGEHIKRSAEKAARGDDGRGES